MRYTLVKKAAAIVKPQFRAVSHVIFDMDGLLLDTECVYTRVIGDIAKKFGRTYTSEVRMKLLGRIEVDTSKIAVQEMELPVPWQEFQKEFAYNSSIQLRKCPLMPGAEKFIRHLKANKIPIAVATSSTEESMAYKTEHLKAFFSLFDHTVCGGSDPDVKHGKPAPDIFLVCASRFPDKPKPQDCLVFEDAPNGARGAIDAGMQCVIIPDPDVPKKLCEHATQIIDSLEDFKPEQFGLPPYQGS